MIHPWKRLGEKVDYDCGFFRILVRQSASPTTGKQYPFYILSTQDWVNILAVTPDKKILLVSQYRHGSDQISLETPGGAVDEQDASPEEAARRELREETGYEAEEWHFIGKVEPNPAIMGNACYYYLALGARPVAPMSLDESEELELRPEDLGNIPRLIESGQIRHSLVVSAFQFLRFFQERNPGKV